MPEPTNKRKRVENALGAQQPGDNQLAEKKPRQSGDTRPDITPFLESNYSSVRNRVLFIASEKAVRLSAEGVFGDPFDTGKPPKNIELNQRFRRLGELIGNAIVRMQPADRTQTIERLRALTQTTHENLKVPLEQRPRLDKGAKALIARGSGVEPKHYRAVIAGQDEAVASAPSANLLKAAYEEIGKAGAAAPPGALDVLRAVAAAISALRYPTQSGQARDDQGRGASHPSDQATNQLRPKGGSGGHDSVNRFRAAAISEAMASVGSNDVYEMVEIGIRTAAAATGNALAIAAQASNYNAGNSPAEARRRQQEDHEGLKRIAGVPTALKQPFDARNASLPDEGGPPMSPFRVPNAELIPLAQDNPLSTANRSGQEHLAAQKNLAASEARESEQIESLLLAS